MPLFDVYPLLAIELVQGKGSYVYDKNGTAYFDLYGGHAVISVGHNHPDFVAAMQKQIQELIYYSNSVHLPLQTVLADKLCAVSSYPDYQLFLCNSGAEANENALKLASFFNQRKKVIAFKGAFHGRTHGAVAITDAPKIKAPINNDAHVLFLELNDETALENAFTANEISAVIIEPIQGVNGIYEANASFLQKIRSLCDNYQALFIADEIQCGYGRTGKFFAHQWANVKPDIISMAKGMGNGFPIGGILVSPKIKAEYGMLGTTFGGAPLACSAAIAVLDILINEQLMENAHAVGEHIKENLKHVPVIKQIRGRGLMLGIEFEFPVKEFRNTLVEKHHILTGNANQSNTLRILPHLGISKDEINLLLDIIKLPSEV
ncbi:MAG TPA: aminotransferase class III-fold pyridoxal phosphate-dependent enzyme [Chitinophagales bacterium]|nr:aminotransferase class III-fold pyridoxal phosphate-dependent enzyme [Chitinophagales bacterium]